MIEREHKIDFEDLRNIMLETYKLDLYEIKHPKLKIDDVLGEQLRQHFFALQLVQIGMQPEAAIASAKDTASFGFKDQNTGRKFNFWHYVKDLMGEFKTTPRYHFGECTIKRGMADPNEQEDLVQLFCYPYIAQGGKFAAPVIDKILDHFGTDELIITAQIGR